MATIRRTAQAVWNGELKGGKGEITSKSGVLARTPYSFGTRFEQAPGTNPEELIAAAHAACYSMAFAHTLSQHGLSPESIATEAICHLEAQPEGGFKITRIELRTEGRVAGLDAERFAAIAQEAEAACPVSNALRAGVQIDLQATLA